ncbi:MAG: glycosyltransferase family 2 protein [Muribaculaceae bacterium]|nr:glycosyltransferase family 2 protein [Muribaculaceae bacterium]
MDTQLSKIPSVSFVMPAYNASAYIADAINSVIGQTVSDWELVIVDDCSSDNTADIARSFACSDTRIRVLKMTHNSGNAFPPRKLAVESSRGNLVAPLDADDTIEERYLEKLLCVKDRSGCDIVYPFMYDMDLCGNIKDRLLPVESFDHTVVYRGVDLVARTLNGWKIGANGGIIDRDLYLRCMEMVTDPSVMNVDEYLTRLLLISAPAVRISGAAYNYRRNPSSVTRSISCRRFDILKCNEMLSCLIRSNFGEGSEEYRLMELQKFCGMIDAVRYFNRHRRNLDRSKRQEVESIIRRVYESIDWRSVKKSGGWKYYHLFRAGLYPASLILRFV